MVYSVEKLNSLVSAARVDLDAFKVREHLHRRSKFFFTPHPSSLKLHRQGVNESWKITAKLTIISAIKLRYFLPSAAEKNRRRVTFWAFVECFLIMAVAAVQILRIRNFFEYKRMV